MTDRQRVVKHFYDALRTRDWPSMRLCFRGNSTLEISGRSPFAGTYQGAEEIIRLFERMVDDSADTFRPVKPRTEDICSSDDHVVLFDWFAAQRMGRELQAYVYFVCAVEHGAILRMFVHSSEQYEFDEFWD